MCCLCCVIENVQNSHVHTFTPMSVYEAHTPTKSQIHLPAYRIDVGGHLRNIANLNRLNHKQPRLKKSNSVFISLQIHQAGASFLRILPTLTTLGAKVSLPCAPWVNCCPEQLNRCRVLWWEIKKRFVVCVSCFLLCFGLQRCIFPTCAPHLARIDEPWNTDYFKYRTECLFFEI